MTKIDNKFRAKVMKASWKFFESYKNKTLANWSKAMKRAWAWAKKTLIKRNPFISGKILKETDRAIQIAAEIYDPSKTAFTSTIWLPKSQIISKSETAFEVSDWIFRAKTEDLTCGRSFI